MSAYMTAISFLLPSSGSRVTDIVDRLAYSFRQTSPTETLVVGVRDTGALERVLHLEFDVPATPRDRQLRAQGQHSIDRLARLFQSPEKRERCRPIAQQSDIVGVFTQPIGGS